MGIGSVFRGVKEAREALHAYQKTVAESMHVLEPDRYNKTGMDILQQEFPNLSRVKDTNLLEEAAERAKQTNKNDLINAHDEMRKILRENGKIIPSRAIFSKDMTNPISIEKAVRQGIEITEGEWTTYKHFNLRRQELFSKGEKFDPVEVTKEMHNAAPARSHWKTIGITWILEKLSRDPFPKLRSSPGFDHWGKIATTLAFSHGVGSFNDLSNPSTFNSSGLVNEYLSDWFKDDGKREDGTHITLGRWGDYKTRGFTLKNTASFNQLASDAKNGRADPALAYYANEFQSQPGSFSAAQGNTAAQTREKTYMENTEFNARTAGDSVLLLPGSPFRPNEP